ncbi:MAG: hypothetical protein ACLQOO_26560 [Terriglobia bacterium]
MKSSDVRKEQQETEERHYFEMFRKVYPLPPGTIEHGDKPDVILNGAQKIGIEMTNLYVADARSASEQVQRVRRGAVVSQAQQLYEETTGNNFQLAFSFDKDHPIRDWTFDPTVTDTEGGKVGGNARSRTSPTLVKEACRVRAAR